MIMACRDREWWLNFVFLGDGRVLDEKERDERRWEIRMRNWDIREFRVPVIWPFLIWQVRVPIQQVITLIRGLPKPIRQVVSRISHIRSYQPYCSQLHHTSLFAAHNSTIIAEHIVKSSLSIPPCHDLEFTLSTAYSEYSLHQVQHPLKIVCLPFIFTITSWPLNIASGSDTPPFKIDHY